ncbi:MAG: hypothetical protein BWX66_01410 [Deltaproteobacteria bacterium ADurb.Bin058]|nr:MAG: hypothetical protein BWX66_01410 [Deltaproteobacteria bacterium ADurb.Bin058]
MSHCQVRVVPGSKDAQTFKFYTLAFNPFCSKGAAFLAQARWVGSGSVTTDFLFNGMLNWQAMAVPSWPKKGGIPLHGLNLKYYIFKDFIQYVPVMNVPVCIWGTIMKNKGFTTTFGRRFQHLFVGTFLLPFLQNRRFQIPEIGFHGKRGVRQL